MKLTVPLLALVVALLLVASQSLYTVDQRQYAIKFQLGEIVETLPNAGLYVKMPILQNVKFYDKRILLLENPEPDRITTSEKKPLLVDFFVLWRITDIKQYYITYKQVYDTITPEGAMVLVPNHQAVMQIIRKSQNVR